MANSVAENELASQRCAWKIHGMKTLTADTQQRVQLPDAKPNQVFSYVVNSDGSLTLIPVGALRQEPFPPGSLLEYMTPDKDAEETALFSGCVQGPE
jgi:hypothetical protein